ncbi:hypothetical protein M011DRAFT_381388, partial [Sporormia fimetaria CBS 119925]
PPRLTDIDASNNNHNNHTITTPPSRPVGHTRSHSFSAVDDCTAASQPTEPGTFRVVIERPPFGAARPKTADTGGAPLLEVPIPHYRLGTPRFSTHGTAILRSSVYTRASGTDDFRSTLLGPGRANLSFLSSRPRSDVYSPAPSNYRMTMEPSHSASLPASARASKLPIGPQLYDALTVNPDDSAVVRFSSSGEILAATPSRLVAHITSPSFLDYELLSDFFLTFRSFLSCRDLVAYLISRLQWAVNRQDDFGRIVRVRTFVALRHWILNYFVDDFAPAYSLRAYFCHMVNGLYAQLKARADGGGGDIKIVGELKKCWRRTCALYWESEVAIGRDSADDDLLPGGDPDSDTPVDYRISNTPASPTPTQQPDRSTTIETIGSNPSDPWARKTRHTPQNSMSSPYIPSQDFERPPPPLSPTSELSAPVLSCSIPIRGMHRVQHSNDIPLYPHPVPNQVQPRFAASPHQSSSSKRSNRPRHGHKRSGSFSDALRDNRAPLSLPKSSETDAAISAMSNMPGSLIRGGVFHPGSPFIDVKSSGVRHIRSQLDSELAEPAGDDMQARQGNAPGPGVKKIIGSVRRALSSKQPSMSSPQITQHAQMPSPARPINPTSLPADGHNRRHTKSKHEVRIDILASRVAESFKEALEQVQKEQQLQSHSTPKADLGGFVFGFEGKGSPTPEGSPPTKPAPVRMYSNITSGSKSIVIMDDTGPLPWMSGGLPSPPTDDEGFVPLGAPLSIDARLSDAPPPVRLSVEPLKIPDFKFPAQTVVENPEPRPSLQRRRSLEGPERMHSFRRRGSRKASTARSGSLRKHASYASGLSRQDTTGSIATFQTMSSDNDPFYLDRNPTGAGPVRQLRRRPGGDLRAVDNVHDLEHTQRPRSTGSVSVRTHSVANSVILRADCFVDPTVDEENRAAQRDAETVKKPISLVATHSSQPNLRPSFEAEVAKLAALPDDIDDDGGIESALMKLEGRYEKKSPDPSPRTTMVPGGDIPVRLPDSSENLPSLSSDSFVGSDTTRLGTADGQLRTVQDMYTVDNTFFQPVQGVHSGVGSDDSYSSMPLLDRGTSDVATSAPPTVVSMGSLAPPVPLKPGSPPTWFGQPPGQMLASPDSSLEYVVETESMKRIPKNGTMPPSSIPRESFLLDDDEDLSDMSDGDSAVVAPSDDTSHGVRSFFDDEPAMIDDEQGDFPMHPLRHPPTPPLTATRPTHATPHINTTIFDRGLPTPGLTPTSRLNNQPFGSPTQPPHFSPGLPIELQDLKPSTPTPSHFPFILSYDSELIAQQLTIIEKDALDEIDWKDLIDLRWSHSSPQITNWFTYLRSSSSVRGVDLVIARFNLVVKWTVSEILLTENLDERVRTVVKFIRVASHCRRLRNYASMYQITVALVSADVAGLRETWKRVPEREKGVLRVLEGLVQPVRNFAGLRGEMEGVVGGRGEEEGGCVPFIGIYTRDLIYNSQKPAIVSSSSSSSPSNPAEPAGPTTTVKSATKEPLVNFERHHSAAMIVKSLLRLLEQSQRYRFKPHPELLSRCLWIAALGDDEV